MASRGIYKHYKGDYYFVHGVGTLHDSETRIVVYSGTKDPERLLLRIEADFDSTVTVAAGFRFERQEPRE